MAKRNLSKSQKLTLGALKAHRTRRIEAAKSTRDRATKSQLLASVKTYDKRIAALAR